MTGQRLTRTAVCLVLAAVSAVALIVLPAVSAQAAPPEVLVSLDGTNFSPTLASGPFDALDLLVPGDSLTASLWVMNSSPDPGLVRVTVDNLVVPSAAFATGVILTADDGSASRTANFGELSNCSIVLPVTTIAAGGVIRIDLTLAMLAALSGLEAQGETAQLGFQVDLRDVASGGYPAANGCPPGLNGPAASGSIAFTGIDTAGATLGWAVAMLVGGILLLVVRRRRDDEEAVG